MLSFVAQNKRENIRKRQAEGIAAAKANGMKFGRPVIKAPDNFPDIVQRWESGTIRAREAAELCGMCESTFYHVGLSMISYTEMQKIKESSFRRDPIKWAHRKVIVIAKMNSKLRLEVLK